MSSDDFFNKLDRDIEEIQAKEQTKSEQTKHQEIQVKHFIEEVIPELENYKKELENRGIYVELKSSQTYLHFKLYYSDGGHHGFMLIRNGDIYKIVTTFTNDDGKNYTGEGSVFEQGPAWTWLGFKKYVQNSINSFIAYAPRHGGYKKL